MASKATKERLRPLARRVPFGVIEAARFPMEAAAHRFGIEKPGAPEPSVILFTMHKVASTFTHDLLGYLNSEILGLRWMDWDKYIHNKYPVPTSPWLADHVDELFRSRGFAYGPFRAPLPIADLDRYRLLMILRDPRDMLTSGYFSEAFSHAPPFQESRLQAFEENRERVKAMAIDDYVLERASKTAGLMDDYLEVAERTGTSPIRYEDMMMNWDAFVADIEQSLGVSISTEHSQELRRRGGIDEVRSDDVTNHIRKGAPGDHREKLKPETVRQLNDVFARHLEWLQIEPGGSVLCR